MYKARVLNMLLYKTKNDADDASMNHGLWTLKEKSDSVPFICNAHTHHKFCRYKHTKHDKKIVVTNVILVAAPANDTEST